MNNYRRILKEEWAGQDDPSHDFAHIERVLASALKIQQSEGGDLDIIIPAVWFHDLINLPKDHPDRCNASLRSADRAVEILRYQTNISDKVAQEIHHAIHAHSFSANILPQTPEAKILQDADRLDALGCIGMMRTFAVSGALKRPLFDPDDPLAQTRELDDTKYALDHFEVKLFKVAETLHTQTAKDIAEERVAFMRSFQFELLKELDLTKPVSEDRHRFGT